MPQVRAKVRVVRKSDYMSGTEKHTEVSMSPMCDEVNKQWAKYTPDGEIRLSINNPAAVDALELGKEYFVDFTRADAPAQA